MSDPNVLQGRLENLFDYLYANAPVRTPLAIWQEVEKIVRTGMFIEDVHGISPAFSFSTAELNRVKWLDSSARLPIASLARAEFEIMNKRLPHDSRLDPIRLNDVNIATVCRALSGVLLSSNDVDVVGEALEVFRHNWTKRNGGQFFTDPTVTRLAIDLLEFDPSKGHDIVDLAAGTGGFLIAAADHSKNKLRMDTTLIQNSLKGVEIDESLARIANTTIGSMIGSHEHLFVAVGDSLDTENSERLDQYGIQDGTHICAATNPPFGSKITINNPTILRTYELSGIQTTGGSRSRSNSRHMPTSLEVLFLERNIRLLKPGEGKLAIVLPYQLTSGPQALPIRRWLLRQAKLEAVIDLPAETFQPYTGTKTCLVLLRRRHVPINDPTLTDGEQIFMSAPKWIGHDRRGRPIFRVSPTGEPTDKVLSDISEVASAFIAFRNGLEPSDVHPESFSIPTARVYSDSQLRFNARYYRSSELLDTVGTLSTKSTTWKAVKLGDVTADIFFPSRFKRRYVEPSIDAVPFLGGTNISQFVPIVEKWLSKRDPKLKHLQVYPGWILITRSGSTGIVSSVPENWSGWAISEHVIRVIPDSDLLDPSYLEAYLRTKFAKASIQRGVFGSVIDEITPEFLRDVDILVPTSQELMTKITCMSEEAQKARQHAIQSILQAVQLVEDSIERP